MLWLKGDQFNVYQYYYYNSIKLNQRLFAQQLFYASGMLFLILYLRCPTSQITGRAMFSFLRDGVVAINENVAQSGESPCWAAFVMFFEYMDFRLNPSITILRKLKLYPLGRAVN